MRQQTTDLKKRAKMLNRQHDHADGVHPENPRLEVYIIKQELETDSCGLNSKITKWELKYGMET